MMRIDRTLLSELGLAYLPDEEQDAFLRHIYETLEMRVGIKLSERMTNEQLDEFETLFDDQAGAHRWLETNFPNYADIVQREFNSLKAEIGASADQILAASASPAG